MYGGNLVTENTKFTWVVLILIRLDSRRMTSCSGSVIHPSWVLTAGHCLYSNGVTTPPENIVMTAYYGLDRYYSVPIDAVFVHPKMLHHDRLADDRLYGDIGMLKTKFETSLGVGRLDTGSGYYPTELCDLAGFGQNGPYNAPYPTMHTMKVRALSENICSRMTSYGICLLVLDGVGPCKGDSGSPMVCDGRVVGLLSSGRTRGAHVCDSTVSGVLFYEPVAEYLSWIEAVQLANGERTVHPATNLIYLCLFALVPYVVW